METRKRGISLIVLIITIIVMIILAGAIILSISNSGIMEKANKAKQESDAANLKEYVNVLEAEWELMTVDERSISGYASKEEYVNKKLADKGYSAAYSAEGEIYTVANDVAKDALSKGIKIGDEVKYTIAEADKEEYTPDSSKTNWSNDELTAQTNLKWIYVGVSEKGELLITPDVSNGVPANSEVMLYGEQGYLTGPDELNTICDKLYTVSGKGTARSMNIDDVARILGYTGEKGAYCEPTSGTYTPTTEAKTITEIAKEIEYDMSSFGSSTPGSGKAIGDYYSDYYEINKTDDVKEMKNSKYVNLIYPSSGAYWLASSCVYARFDEEVANIYNGSANFCIYIVSSQLVGGAKLFGSCGVTMGSFNTTFRPVVSLTSTIQKSTENGSTVWTF